MKIKIRKGVFETNSSSTHSLTLCSEETFDAWKKGDLVLNDYESEFVPLSSLSKEELEDLDEEQFYTFDGYFDNYCEEMESFVTDYTTPKGEAIVAFGCYGYN